jgi:hypothetical protein
LAYHLDFFPTFTAQPAVDHTLQVLNAIVLALRFLFLKNVLQLLKPPLEVLLPLQTYVLLSMTRQIKTPGASAPFFYVI